jgi:vanillate O-demethylase monooxygenase subunit
MWKTPSAELSTPGAAEAGARGFPVNAWYAVGWDYEVARGLLARTVAGRPMVFYRTASGRAVALADACWHRLAPLSMGKLVGDDQIQCPYHGIRYDGEGRCTFMPAQETINPSASVASFPIVERYRFVWVWPGDPAKADPDLVPDLHWNDDPEWAGDGETMYIACDYRLALDNLMDLTHEEFVHGSSIGTEEISVAGFDSSHSGQTATIGRHMHNIQAPPFLAQNLADRFPGYTGLIDRWQIVNFEAPSAIVIDGGATKAGTGTSDDYGEGVRWKVLFAVTPAEAGRCHYFWSFVRDYSLADQSITTRHRQAIARVFEEDHDMLEAQQRAIDANPEYDFYNLNIDAGTMWMRRIITDLIDAETSGESAAETDSPVSVVRKSAVG